MSILETKRIYLLYTYTHAKYDANKQATTIENHIYMYIYIYIYLLYNPKAQIPSNQNNKTANAS